MSTDTAISSREKPLPLGQWLQNEKNLQRVEEVLPKGTSLDAKRLLKIAALAINKEPKLLRCDRFTVLESILEAAALGLHLNNREAYLIPYQTTCKLMIDYKGFVKLALTSGEISSIHCDVVYQNDKFEVTHGENAQLNHEPDYNGEDRGKIVAAYSYVKFKDGSSSHEVMTLKEIENVRKTSAANGSSPWKNHFAEMAKKTVFRRHTKWLALDSHDFITAMDIDDQHFEQKPEPRPEPKFDAEVKAEVTQEPSDEWDRELDDEEPEGVAWDDEPLPGDE